MMAAVPRPEAGLVLASETEGEKREGARVKRCGYQGSGLVAFRKSTLSLAALGNNHGLFLHTISLKGWT